MKGRRGDQGERALPPRDCDAALPHFGRPPFGMTGTVRFDDGRTGARSRQAARLKTTNICDVRMNGRRAKSMTAKSPSNHENSG